MDKQIKEDVKDLLNQLVIKLKDVKEPTSEDDEEGGYSNLGVRFENSYSDVPSLREEVKLGSVKVVVKGLLDSINNNEKWGGHVAEKMARAYYTSFCN